MITKLLSVITKFSCDKKFLLSLQNIKKCKLAMTALDLEKKKEDFIARFYQSTNEKRIDRTIECFYFEGLLQDDDPETDKVWDALPFFCPKTYKEAMQRLKQAGKDIDTGNKTPHEVFFKEIDNMISTAYAKN